MFPINILTFQQFIIVVIGLARSMIFKLRVEMNFVQKNNQNHDDRNCGADATKPEP